MNTQNNETKFPSRTGGNGQLPGTMLGKTILPALAALVFGQLLLCNVAHADEDVLTVKKMRFKKAGAGTQVYSWVHQPSAVGSYAAGAFNAYAAADQTNATISMDAESGVGLFTGGLGATPINPANLSTVTPLSKGGTGANLSATGPGALIQATTGANVTVATLPATLGGTSFATYATGDTIYASNTNVLSKLAGNGTGTKMFYTMTSSVPSYASILIGDLPTITEPKGGTNQTSYAAGDILYASATNTLARLPIGTNGYVLSTATGLPVWIDPATLPGGGGGGHTQNTDEGTNQNSFMINTDGQVGVLLLGDDTGDAGSPFISGDNDTGILALNATDTGDIELNGGTGSVMVNLPAEFAGAVSFAVAPTGSGANLTSLNPANLSAAVPYNKGGHGHTAVALGDTLAGASSSAWNRVTGNITTTRKFYRQVGDGVNSALPAWDTIGTPDLPATVMYTDNTQTVTGQKTFSNVLNSFTGVGTGLTINASNLNTGTIPNARYATNITLAGTITAAGGAFASLNVSGDSFYGGDTEYAGQLLAAEAIISGGLSADSIDVETTINTEDLVVTGDFDGVDCDAFSFTASSEVNSPLVTATEKVVYGGGQPAVESKSAGFTASATVSVYFCNGSFTIILPAPSGAGANTRWTFKNTGSGTLTFDPAGAVTVDGAATKTSNTQYESFDVLSDGTNYFIL